MSEEKQQAIPGDGMRVSRPMTDAGQSFSERDPELNAQVQGVIDALRADLIPPRLQHDIFEAMSIGTQREVIARASGLDAGVLASFKRQTQLLDSILRRTFHDDGSIKSGADDLGMEPKDVLALSQKNQQQMVRDLPKIINMDRIRKIEESLYAVMADHMTREQQEALLAELDRRQGDM